MTTRYPLVGHRYAWRWHGVDGAWWVDSNGPGLPGALQGVVGAGSTAVLSRRSEGSLR
jgi:hypothetical protein